MSTIYLRDVPEDVTRDLKELAERAGMSLNKFVVRELREVARRIGNRDLLESLPDRDVAVQQILEDLEDGRFRNARP